MSYKDERIFTGGMNSDDDGRTVPNGDVRSLEYCRLGESSGNGFCVVTSLGTIVVANLFLQPEDRILGARAWIEGNAILYLVYIDTGVHQLWKYDIAAETHQAIASSTEFNFQKGYPITHIVIIDGMVFWCDRYWNDTMYNNGTRLFNPPMHIDIQRAIDGDYTSFDFQAINFVKFPPIFGPTCEYGTDQRNADNKLRSALYRFRTQNLYWNNELSAWSPYSNLPLATVGEFVDGTNWAGSQVDNYINVTIDTGHFSIRKINVAVSKNDAQFGIFIQIDKDLLGLADNVPYTFRYYGNTSDYPLPLALKNYDRVPLQSDCMEKIPENIVAFVNYVEQYNKAELDMTVEAVYTEVPIRGRTTFVNCSISPFTTGVIIEVPAPTTSFGFFAGIAVTIDFTITTALFPDPFTINLAYVITAEDMLAALAIITGINITRDRNMYIMFAIATAFAAQINAYFTDANATVILVLGGFNHVVITTVSSVPVLNTFGFALDKISTYAKPTLKTGAHHQYYMQYYDEANRDGTALTIPLLKLYVPFPSEQEAEEKRVAEFVNPNNPYRVNLKFTINQIPPIEFTHWQILERSTTEISDFQQVTITNITSEGNRWLIDIQSKYQIENKGATIEHQISKGDKMRFLKERYVNSTNPAQPDYIEKYFELEILEYLATGGLFGNQRVAVEKFQLSSIDGTSTYRGQLVEIYTPQPILNVENSSLFVAECREIGIYGTIANPHTDYRYHVSPFTITGTCVQAIFGDTFVIVTGNKLGAVGGLLFLDTSETQVITSESYDAGLYQTTYNFTTPLFAVYLVPTPFTASFNQIVSAGVSTQAATIFSDWGDVWLRYRQMNCGYTNNISTDPLFYSLIEDPRNSDYWPSKISGAGRIAASVPQAKQVRKKASALHGGNFIDNSQINNLCSFELIFGESGIVNIQDMDEEWGGVTRAILDGKTLKCIQPRKENSIYIKAAGYSVTGDGNEAPVSISNIVFTQWRPSQSAYGTQYPDSVLLSPYNNIMYFDAVSGCFVEAFENGPMNISAGDYKFLTRSRELAQITRDYETQVTSYVDETNTEVAWCFRYEFAPTIFGYVIVAFDYSRRRWRTEYSYNHLRFANLGNVLVGFAEDNQLHKHNEVSDTFHGDTASEAITLVSNATPSQNKRLDNIAIRTNKRDWAMSSCTTPAAGSYPAQRTNLSASEFSVKENYLYGQVKRDVNTPNFATVSKARINGNVMRAASFEIEISRPIDTEDNGQTVTFSITTMGVLSEVLT